MKKIAMVVFLVGLVALVACNQSNEDVKANTEVGTQKIQEVLSTLSPVAPGVLVSARPNGITLVMFPAKFSNESLTALQELASLTTNKRVDIRDRQSAQTQWEELGVVVANMDEETKLDIQRLVSAALLAHDQYTTLEASEIGVLDSDYDNGWYCTAAASAWPTSWEPGAKAEAWVSCSSYRSDTYARATARAGNNSDSDYDSGRYGSSAFAVAYVGNSYQYCNSKAEAYGYYWVSDWARIIDALAYASNYDC